jgi:hypothetical protein
MKCRFCETKLEKIFADLGMSPLANSYLINSNVNKVEKIFPLCAYVCKKCLLVQVEKFESPKKIFSNYAYFSSYSKSWVKNNFDFAKSVISQFGLNNKSQVIEIASNDGYLLQHFQKSNIPVLGIDPAKNVAKVAQKKGIKTITKFFGTQTASEIKNNESTADVLIAINVLPHTPELIDFIKGMKILLKANGVIIIQFSAYMLEVLKNIEFDMIYHEHFSYFSLHTIQKIFSSFGLTVFDVHEIPVHGGSLRIFVKNTKNKEPINPRVQKQLEKEKRSGMREITTYTNFPNKIKELKIDLWNFFITAKNAKKTVVCYGATAKGNTLLNYCGIGKDFVEYTADISPHKQGLFLPGTHIPIQSPEKIFETKPDYVLILAWNIKEEIIENMKEIKKWGGKFVIPSPKVKILS